MITEGRAGKPPSFMTLLGNVVKATRQGKAMVVQSEETRARMGTPLEDEMRKGEKLMSMQPRQLEPVPETTSRTAGRSFPKGTFAMDLRDELERLSTDEMFADLSPKRGRPAEAPWRLAVVTVLQTIEHLTDRQAADAVRARIDWKYAATACL